MAPAKLRVILDGEVNSASYRRTQRDVVQRTITCNSYSMTREKLMDLNGSTSPMGNTTGADPNTDNRLAMMQLAAGNYVVQSVTGDSILDRGALFEAALRKYAPDLSLTREETGDPAVQRRFDLREVPRNRLRLPLDRDFFAVAVCMVRMEPELATAMLRTDPGSSGQRRIQANLIYRARACIGNAVDVRTDATQFRLYIFDALYRWTVAARGVDTLVPSAGPAGNNAG